MNTITPSQVIDQSTRIIIKIGSALLTDEKSGTVKQAWLNGMAEDIEALIAKGKQVVLVSSGAIALGRKALGVKYTDSPSSIPLEMKQAAAALGQVQLCKAYEQAFTPHDRHTSLILLTPKDTEERRSHVNARATIMTLIKNNVIPIINENDTVSTTELKFGDNDRLAARVAQMVGADMLLQFSTIDGLYTDDPTQNKNAEHVPFVESLNDDHQDMAGDAPKGLSTGGMKSKLKAADIAMSSGANMLIACGVDKHPLLNLMDGKAKATIFKASTKPLSARKKWISSHLISEGDIIIDDGACNALKKGKSLLAAGVLEVKGEFSLGDPVEIFDKQGNKLAIGLAGYNSNESKRIVGCNSTDIPAVLGYARGDALIHRANLVLQQ